MSSAREDLSRRQLLTTGAISVLTLGIQFGKEPRISQPGVAGTNVSQND